MDDLGAPSSYMALDEGTEVLSSDGQRLGKVAHVLADPGVDVFDGIVIDTSVLPGGHRFADASQIAGIYVRGVVLTIDAAAADALPEPSENPAVMDTGAADMVPDDLGDKLRRAWGRLSGRG